MSIQVNDFQWEPGKNDTEYIKLLKSSRDEWQKIAQKAITKLKTLSRAQEPVSVQKKPMEMVGLQTWDWACGNCGQTVLFGAKFCPWCGRALKWK